VFTEPEWQISQKQNGPEDSSSSIAAPYLNMRYSKAGQGVRDQNRTLAMLMFLTGKTYEDLKPEIEKRAYALWEADGRKEGLCLTYWAAAEQSIINESREGD
jgi:hypothetical protein